MVSDSNDSEELVADLYEAAFEAERWPSVLASLQASYDAHMGMIAVSYPFSGRGEVVARNGLPAEFAERWEAEFGWSAWSQAARTRELETGDVVRGSDLVPTEVVLDSPMGRELVEPLDAKYMLAAIVIHSSVALGHLTLYRGRDFDDREVESLGRLAGHIARAFAMHTRALWLRDRAAAFDSLVESVPFGLVVVDGDRRVQLVNRRAERILSEEDGLRTTAARSPRSPRLDVTNPGALQRLDEALRRGAQLSSHPERCLVAVPRPSGRRPLQIAVSPAVHALGEAGAGSRLLWINDPEDVRVPSTEALQTFFDLTPAEARAAAAVASGLTLRQHADRAGVGYEAARFSLKGAFAKTRTSRQAELAALIHRSLPPIAFER